LKQLLYYRQFALVIAGAVGLYLLLKVAPRRRGTVLVALTIGAATLGLFIIHKFPVLTSVGPAERVKIILTAIGFSYVALRIVEILRAVCEGRHAPPALPATINYLYPFHMLAAGPIQSYDDFVSQPPLPKSLTLLETLRATERIAWGLFKKFVLA